MALPRCSVTKRTIRHLPIDQAIFPLQPEWGQRHSMSGVFSMAAHSVLQYLLPSLALQLQGG